MTKIPEKAVRAYNFDMDCIEWLKKKAHKTHVSTSHFVNNLVREAMKNEKI